MYKETQRRNQSDTRDNANKDDTAILLDELIRELMKHPALELISTNEMGPKKWKEFIAQRYLIGRQFEHLLTLAKSRAISSGDTNLANVLQENLNDELGVDSDGQQLPTGSHAKWRKDFYRSLAMSNTELERTISLPGTNQYNSVMGNLCENPDFLKMAGAILYLEKSIPPEFKQIRKGRDILFPDTFAHDTNDSTDIKKQKGEARLYMDHHIAHDAQSHFPDLMKALKKYLAKDDTRARVIAGIQTMAMAKKGFYDSIQTEIVESR